VQITASPRGTKIFGGIAFESLVDHLNFQTRKSLLDEKVRFLDSKLADRLEKKLPPQRVVLKRPFPKSPRFVKDPLKEDLFDLVLNYFSEPKEKRRVKKILEDRVLGSRFGSDWIGGRWRMITPVLKQRREDLQGVSHELGHLLSGEPRNSSFFDQVKSEAMALMLESLIVESSLEERDLEEWRSYCAESDLYNFEFFRREFFETTSSLLEPGFIFRESLWTSHGYQAIYACASLIRNRLFSLESDKKETLIRKIVACQ